MGKIPDLKLTDDLARKEEIAKYGENAIYSRAYLTTFLKTIGRPVKLREILCANPIKNLNIPLKKRIQAMVRAGDLVFSKKNGYMVNTQALLEGYVVTSRYGYGFVVIEGREDLFLNPHQMGKVLERDRIRVRVVSDRKGREEGEIVAVISRAKKYLFGTVCKKFKQTVLLPVEAEIRSLPLVENDVPIGSLVKAVIVEDREKLSAKIAQVLTDGITLELMEDYVINNFNLLAEFSPEVLEIANRLQPQKEIDFQGREDWQGYPFVTIDGSDAKDFDDAVYGEKNLSGYRLWVAIADVSHYVLAGDFLDNEARLRGNSVYFPQRVLPMLPEILSNDLCSLKPNLPRLAVGCMMELDETGEIKNFSFQKVVVRSKARLTYDGVFNFLEKGEGEYPAEVGKNLNDLKEIYEKLNSLRKKRWALDFNREEVNLIFDEKQNLISITPKYGHYVHGIIEEAMLLTNVCAAQWLKDSPALYRVHTPPKMEKLLELQEFLAKLGIKFGKSEGKITVKDYACLLQELEKRKEKNLLNLKLLRSLNQACYSWKNAGHFALAYREYLHFTSPIRRYPDLHNHRLIKDKIDKKGVTQLVVSPSLPEHCSETERRADEASSQLLRWYQCQYLSKQMDKVVSGIVVGMNEFKMWVELKETLIEGAIELSSLGRFRLLPNKISLELFGKSTIIYTLGDEIKVKIKRVDVIKREVILQIV